MVACELRLNKKKRIFNLDKAANSSAPGDDWISAGIVELF